MFQIEDDVKYEMLIYKEFEGKTMTFKFFSSPQQKNITKRVKFNPSILILLNWMMVCRISIG